MALIPRDTALYHLYRGSRLDSVQVVRGISSKWSTLLPVLRLIDAEPNDPRWYIPTFQPTTTQEQTVTVTCISYSRDGLLLAAGTSEGRIIVLDAISGRVLHNFNIGDYEDESYSDDQDLDDGASDAGSERNDEDEVSIDPRNQESTHADEEASAGPQDQESIDADPQESANTDEPELETQTSQRSRSERLKAVCFSFDNESISAIFYEDSSVLVLSLRADPSADSNTNKGDLNGHSDVVNDLSFGAQDVPMTLASASSDATIRIWDAERLTCTSTIEVRGVSSSDSTLVPVLCVEFLPGGDRIIGGCEDKTIRIWSVEYGTERYSYSHTSIVNMLSVSPDKLAFVDKNFAVHITSPDLHDPIEAYSHHERIETIKFLPGKKILASADTKGVYLWDLTKKDLLTISSPMDDVQCVAITSSPSEDRVQVALGAKK